MLDPVGVDEHLGEFLGVRYDPDEAPTDEVVTLSVTSGGGETRLERRVPRDPEVPASRFRHEVHVVLLSAPALSFEAAVDLVAPVTGGATFDWEGDPAAVAAVPAPIFEVDAAEDVVVVNGAGGDPGWWFEVAWGREVPSAEPGVGLTRALETVFWGFVEPR